MSEPLNIASLPLNGVQLIEASAGTGKTWSITGLYLRWVLGIDAEPLEVDRILVVTFTNAAVAELRGRIRARLREALDVLEGKNDDAFLVQLIGGAEKEPARVRLTLALSSMDNAAIYTIHSFCKRLLSQYAFEAGMHFDLDMQEGASEFRQQAVRDYWRQHAWSDSPTAYLLATHFSHAGQLEKILGRLLGKADVPLLPAVSLEQALEAAAQKEAALEALREAWLVHGREAYELVSDHLDRKVLSGVRVKRMSLDNTYRQFDEWAHGGRWNVRIEMFSQQWLGERCNKGKDDLAPQHAFLALVDDCLPVIERAASIELPGLLAHARAHILAREADLKQRSGQLSADDLLTETCRALKVPSADTLVTLVRQRFPVAMVDEFQDTDSIQYAIFSTLYGQTAESALLMIGDPKQAIYGFRGADIFAYLKAREDSAGQFHLDTNFRSTADMVAAVNTLFSVDNPFLIEQLTFQSVKANDGKQPFSGDDTRKAVHLALADADIAHANAEAQHQWRAEWIATEIRRLLGNAEAKIGDKRLKAGDIAVLVRGHKDARRVRDALARLDLPCVYSGREGVFSSDQADDLVLLLAALVEPENGAAVRNALACTLLDLPLDDLYERVHEETRWAETLNEFLDAQQLWRRRGILPALYHLFETFDTFTRLRADAYGERQLTDLLHLCELLQHQHSRGDGPRELLRWLQRQRETDGEVADEQKLRLETDDQLVQVTTIHASKGLQYPITFVAGMSQKGNDRSGALTWFHDDNEQLVACLDANDEARAKASLEQRAEDMRLLYVALTRSIYRCYVMLESHKSLAESPLGPLLPLASDKPEWADMLAAAEQLSDNTISFSSDMPARGGALADNGSTSEPVEPEPLPTIDDHWRVTSYTGLTRHLDAPKAEYFADESMLVDITPAPGTIAAFPRGARAGICLHSILEQVQFPVVDAKDYEAPCRTTLQDMGFDASWAPLLARLIVDTARTPFGDAANTCLDRASAALAEMEFMLSVAALESRQLDNAVALLDADIARPALTFSQVEGMLRGFIDLVFVCDGRYWLVDYKSNWLGATPAEYHAANMDLAVAEHRYDIQAAIYAVALHRYLQATVPSYSPAQHFGGIAYLFLRGIDGNTAGQGVWLRQPDAATLQHWDTLLGGAQ